MIGISSVNDYSDQPVDVKVIILLHEVLEVYRARFVLHHANVFALIAVLERVRPQVQHVRDVQLRIHLYIFERFKAKHDSLQMQNEHVRRFCQQFSLLYVDTFFAALTVIVVDQTSLMTGTQRLMHSVSVLHLKGQSEEGVRFVLGEAAFSAHELTDLVAFENIVHQVFLRGIFKFVFQPVKECVQEFLCILLLTGICWVAVIIFEGEREVFGVI